MCIVPYKLPLRAKIRSMPLKHAGATWFLICLFAAGMTQKLDSMIYA